MAALEPCDRLEKTLRIVHAAFGFAGIKYWLGFGGLYGVIKNRGVIPDGDLDLCCLYGDDWERLSKALAGRGYRMSKAILDDTDPSKALYCGFNHDQFVHLCVSFWYPHGDKRYYCHDERRELAGPGVPPSGYFFKGVPREMLEDELYFRWVEWPGIDGGVKVRVPMFPGAVLDNLYPCWAYQHQKYNVGRDHAVQDDKLGSVYHGGATSRFKVHVQSMGQWKSAAHVASQLEESEAKWRTELKRLQKAFR